MEPIIKILVPRIDSSYDGWNSPSENLEIITLPRLSPNDFEIFSAKSMEFVQLKIFAFVFDHATVFDWFLNIYI